MREKIQKVISGDMTINQLIDELVKKENDPNKRAEIINNIWKELDIINQNKKQSISA